MAIYPSSSEIADLRPNVASAVLRAAAKNGCPPDRLCRGLGFEADGLMSTHGVNVSYRQLSTLVRRFHEQFDERVSGIAVGALQTPLSWGLTGLGMLACRTLREAVEYGVLHQQNAGAVFTHSIYEDNNNVVVDLVPRYESDGLTSFFVEDCFSSILAVVRSLIGTHLRPEQVLFNYRSPADIREYVETFDCPLYFSQKVNRMVIHAKWLESEIWTYDPYISASIRGQLDSLMDVGVNHQNDLLESVSNLVRARLDTPRTIGEVASELNMSTRTLNRRLSEQGVTFQKLVDKIRYEKASALLARRLRVDAVAEAVGFSDTSNFRRAFKRWQRNLSAEFDA